MDYKLTYYADFGDGLKRYSSGKVSDLAENIEKDRLIFAALNDFLKPFKKPPLVLTLIERS